MIIQICLGPGAVPIRNHFKRLKPIDAVTARQQWATIHKALRQGQRRRQRGMPNKTRSRHRELREL